MLVKKDMFNKNKSIYMCDRCKRKMYIKNKIGIHVAFNIENPKKKWDLCFKCYNALERGIEKGGKHE